MDLPVDNDDLGFPQRVEGLEGIPLDHLDVGQFPGLDRPEPGAGMPG